MKSVADSMERARKAAEMVKAIAHPVRLRIIALLCRGDARVGTLVKQLKLKQAAVSQQLRILRMSGLVAVDRQGAAHCYRIAEPRLRELIRCIDSCKAPSPDGGDE